MVTDEREGFGGAMSRIVEHPILGAPSKGSRVVFTYDGVEMEGCEGEPIAMALKAAGMDVRTQDGVAPLDMDDPRAEALVAEAAASPAAVKEAE